MPAKYFIQPLTTIQEMFQLEELQRRIWPGSETDIVPAHILLTIAQNGGQLLGAISGEAVIGFILGFLGTDHSSPERVAMARLKFCSHMLGVHPDYRSQGIGYSLKVAQRQGVIEQGIRLVTWTYDPLVSLNAHLNIRRLGAVCRTYIRDAYGDMRDALNVGQASDRFQVDWWVTSPRVISRIEGSRPPLDLANFLAAGAEKINPASLGDDDLARPAESFREPQGNLALVEIPPNYDVIKEKDPGLASAWRTHTRQLFEAAFSAGYLVTDFVYLKGERLPRSYYLLSFGESTLG